MRARSKGPAQQRRNQYVAAVRARGASGHNLWFVVPPQDPANLRLTLSSDIEFEAFLFLEGSPDLVHVDYAPLRLARSRPAPGPRHFATATTVDGADLDIELWPAGSKASEAGRRLLNMAALNTAQTRIQSWRAIVATINRCRPHALNPLLIRARHLLDEHAELTAGAFCRLMESEHPALVMGAVATLLRAREIDSDVDQHLWGPGTRFREAGRG